jgi:hypothetical protein
LQALAGTTTSAWAGVAVVPIVPGAGKQREFPMCSRSRLLLAAVVLCSPSFAAAQVDPEPYTEPYALVDNQQADWTNLNLYPFRAMAWTADGTHLYAVNTHDSTVRHFDYSAGNPPTMLEHRVPWGPVSVAIYDAHSDGIDRLLVVCRGTHALAILDRVTGEVLEMLELHFEPADILVVDSGATDYAYISCSGARQVGRVNLATLATTWIDIPAIQTAWMALHPDGRVLVAPLISGNNSSSNGSAIVDLDVDPLNQFGELPDEDLFAIDPTSLVVTAISRKAGSVLFAHGVNPASGGRHWQLNLDSINKNPSQQSEPDHKGKFAKNRLTLTALPGSGSTTSHAHVDLDDFNSGQSGKQPLALPTGLSFAPSGELAIAVGVGTDNAILLSTASGASEGTFVANSEMSLPSTSIPRYALFDPSDEETVAIYCWGTNKIEFFQVSVSPPVHLTASTLSLGYDPTPFDVRQGRNIFYDAARSLNGNLNCASCHIEGSSDQLGWDLSDRPRDTKGALVTQTLFGIDRLAPFHWRGERPELEDFNGAFPGLLGASSELSPQDMAWFKAFVFSLRSPANIGASEYRVLDDFLAQAQEDGYVGSAINGQDLFRFEPVIPPGNPNGRACNDCHALPAGSNGDTFDLNPSSIPSMFHLEVPGFNELEDKDSRVVDVTGLNPVKRALTGFGLSHVGQLASRHRFEGKFLTALGGPQHRADVVEFLIQFDSGFGKVIHRGTLLDVNHPGNAARISDYLIPQVELGNGSLAVWGTYPVSGTPTEVTWKYDTATDEFVPDRNSLASIPLSDFVTQAAAGTARNFFVGLPPGNSARAIDWDLDGLVNKRETALGTDPYDPDTDNDGLLDGSTPGDTTAPLVQGLQILWTTAKNARLVFTTNEPVKIHSLVYSATNVPSQSVTPPADFSKVYSLILPKLQPSTIGGPTHNYGGTLIVKDDAGNQTSTALPSFSTDPFENDPQPFKAVIGNLQWTSTTPSGGTLVAQGKVRVDQKVGGPPAIGMSAYVVVANVLVNGQITSFTTTTSPTTTFKVNGVNYTALPGPFLITAKTVTTPVLGEAAFNFTVTGLSSGDVVRFNIIGVFAARPAYSPNYTLANPDFGLGGSDPVPASTWSLPDTLKGMRAIEYTYP